MQALQRGQEGWTNVETHYNYILYELCFSNKHYGWQGFGSLQVPQNNDQTCPLSILIKNF